VKASAEDRGPKRDPDRRAAASPVRESAGAPISDVGAAAPEHPMSATVAQRLQSAAGNRAVSALLGRRREAVGPPVQRLASGGAGPRSGGPDSDPKFAALKADLRGKQKRMSAHPPATAEARAAQGAAKPPQDDKEAQGKAANAEKMNAAKPGEFDKAAFVRAVNEAIAAQAPKNLDEAAKFGESGKADAVKGQVAGQVTAGKKTSAGQIESTTKAPPDTSAAKDKPVTALRPDQPPPAPGAPDPALAVPDRAPPSATDFSAGPRQVDGELAGAQVSEEQLARSNEPQFTGALADKKEGEKHAATAPGIVRGKEAQTLAGAKAQAAQAGTATMTALAASRRHAGAQVGQGKDGAKGRDEAKRAQVTSVLQKVFDATKADVEVILSGLDKKVDDAFSAGEKAARDAFTAEHQRRMDEYKDRRYSGFSGKLRWVKDKFAGLPEEANQIFVQARQGYVARMQQVIAGVADVIGAELNRAKQRIATGRDQLQAEVRKLDPDLQAIGKEAAGAFAGKFDELTESVDAKGTELVQTLASRYNEALKSVDDEIDAEKEKNKGLIAKAVDAVKGVIDTILKLKDLLLGVLAKAAQAVLAILKDPIGFLGNLISAVGAGLRAFMANIGEHLKKGLVGWLMGAMASAGLELPAKFDLRGILAMIASLLGLTWGAIRGRIVSRGVPEQAMGAVEQSVPVAQKLQAEGVAGVWEQIKEKVGDLKANLFGKISEYLIPTVLMAGITWIISLLNPASAFIKACKMIIDIVTFIIDRGAQIIEFVSAVLDAVIAIAGGGAGGVPALIEGALAKSIPVLIGALAAILGVGGIADRVKKFVQSLAKPVMKAVDWVVDRIVGFGKKIWAKLKGKGRKKKSDRTDGRLDPARLRTAVARDLRTRLPDGTDPSRVRAAASEVYRTWQPRGLRKLEVHAHAEGSSTFDVLVTASPRTKVYDFTADLAADPGATGEDRFQEGQPFRVDQDMKLDKNESTRAQVSLAWPQELDKLRVAEDPTVRSGDRFWYDKGDGTRVLVPRRTLGRWLKNAGKKIDANQKGVHAEVAALESVKSRWSQLPDVLDFKAKFGYDPICWLQIHVTRSPCSSCADAILGIRQFAAGAGWTMKAKVSAFSLYHVGGNDSTEAVQAIRKLTGAGVTVTVLQLPPEHAQKLAEKNPKVGQLLVDKARRLAEVILGAE
jgi:Skp family chaperone for outer membrane proteins